MELFKHGRVFDFWGQHKFWLVVSTVINVLSAVLMFYPGVNMGTDFKGGTEIEVNFKVAVDANDVRSTVESLGFHSPDVVKVEDGKSPSRFLIRVQEVSALNDAQRTALMDQLCYAAPNGGEVPVDRCPVGSRPTEIKFSPGGDKLSMRFEKEADLALISKQMLTVSGVEMRKSPNNPQVVSARDHKVEVQLKSKGDMLMDGLIQKLGPDKVPETPLRVEWVGPKAGKLLRDAAFKSVGVTIVFIMAYIAFRFDMRFAPGAVISMVHDVFVVMFIFVLSRKEFTLSTVAALLTVVGFSVNDTVIIYDRIRENLGKHRGKNFPEIINLSISETLSRTLLTSFTTLVSLGAFLIFGSGTIKDFAFALFFGFITGTYSSIFIASPVTEYIDRKFFGHKTKVPAKPGTFKAAEPSV